MALSKGKLLIGFTLVAGAIVYIDNAIQLYKLSNSERFWPGSKAKPKK